MNLMQWTPTDLARLLDCQPKIVRRWLAYDPNPAQVPTEVLAWAESMAATVGKTKPRGWKRRL